MIRIKSITEYCVGSGFVNFDCGDSNLNEYLKKYARQNESRQISRTFLLLDNFEVMGFYTISTADISIESLSAEEKRKLPNYPIPCIRIARLAIDLKFQNQGFGKMMLKDIILKVLSISSVVGVYAIIVDSKDNAISFYEHYGFTRIDSSTNTLVLPLASLVKRNRF